MIVALALTAHAEPLVYTGDPAPALERVATATRLSASDFTPVAADELRNAPPTVGDGGTLTACGGPVVTREQLLLAVEGAEGASSYGETERARSELARVSDTDRCAPWDPELLGRYFVLRALLDDDATDGFAKARRVKPDLAWNPEWPAERRAAFEVGAPAPAVQLALTPDGYTLDGARVSGRIQVVPGWHRLSGPAFDGSLVLEADGTFLVPESAPATVFEDLTTEEQRFLPTALLASKFGEGSRVFVANDRGVWAATAGRVDWLSLQRQRTSPLVWAGVATTLVGLAGGGTFGALSVGARQNAQDAAGRMSAATTRQGFDAAGEDFETRQGKYYTLLGGVGASAGVVVLGAGLTLVGTARGPQTVTGAP